MTHGQACTVRVRAVQGPLPGHAKRRVWLCHYDGPGGPLFPGVNQDQRAGVLCVPEEWLVPVPGEEPRELVQVLNADGTALVVTDADLAQTTKVVNGKRVKR